MLMQSPRLRSTLRAIARKFARLLDPPHPDQTLGNLTYAQHGEDIVLLSIFQNLGMASPRYLDIGAHHPYYISNTALLHERGSRGVNVEANPHLIAPFRQLRPSDVTLNVAVAAKAGEMEFYFIDDHSGRNTCDRATAEEFVRKYPKFAIRNITTVPVTTIAAIYSEHFAPADIDLLSIDVEGLDYEVLESAFAAAIFPKVIVVEVVSGGDSNHAAAICDLLHNNGYFLLIRLGANYIAVRNEFRSRVI